jgi:hypothetical protein
MDREKRLQHERQHNGNGNHAAVILVHLNMRLWTYVNVGIFHARVSSSCQRLKPSRFHSPKARLDSLQKNSKHCLSDSALRERNLSFVGLNLREIPHPLKRDRNDNQRHFVRKL